MAGKSFGMEQLLKRVYEQGYQAGRAVVNVTRPVSQYCPLDMFEKCGGNYNDARCMHCLTLVHLLDQMPEENVAYQRIEDAIRQENKDELEKVATSNNHDGLNEALRKLISLELIRNFLQDVRREILDGQTVDELPIEELTTVASLDEVCRLLEKPKGKEDNDLVVSFSDVSSALNYTVDKIQNEGGDGKLIGVVLNEVREALGIETSK